MRPSPYFLLIALAAAAACGKKETPNKTAAAPPAAPRAAGPAEYTLTVKRLPTKANCPPHYPHDAHYSGGDDGTSYKSADRDTNPKKATTRNTNRHFLPHGKARAVATLTLVRTSP